MELPEPFRCLDQRLPTKFVWRVRLSGGVLSRQIPIQRPEIKARRGLTSRLAFLPPRTF